MATTLLELRQITKAFGPKVANDRISLSVMPGRVHALVGENGAGKTTLMTMVAGTAQPDSGQILVDGKETRISSPQRAAALGIGMVHQHFKLVPSLTVAANIFLGREHTTGGRLDTARMEAEVAELSERFGLEIDPRAKVSSLSVGQRQRVEVLKALSHDTRLLILDEPTAVLTPGETDELFVVIRSLAERGCAVLFISHKLGEVLAIADEVTVIRDGRTIDTLPAAGLSQADIARMMVGREVLLRIAHTPATPAEEVLAVEDLTVVDDRGVTVLKSVSLSVRAGEIVGVAGVEGNGQSELAAAVAGMHPVDGGRVVLDGTDVTAATVATRRQAGLAYIPEDRHEVGTGPAMSVAENLTATHTEAPVARRGWISTRWSHAFAQRLIGVFDVRGAGPRTPIGTLSGGNIQKVIIAREFASDPRLLMVSQPTRGVDVGAMEFVHNAIVRRRDQGAAVLLFSADLNEVMSLSDRLLVMYRGEVIAEFTQETMSEAAVGLAMAGVPPTQDKVAEAERHHEQVIHQLGEPVAAVSAAAEVDTSVAIEETGAAGRLPADLSPAALLAEGGTDDARHKESAGQWLRRTARSVLTGSVQPVVAIGLSLLIGLVIILALGSNPLDAYDQLFFSAFRTPFGTAGFIAQFVPLAVLSAAVIISFRAGFFNIGGEGQLFLGAMAGAWVGFTFTDLPPVLLTVLMLVAGVIAGGLWGLLPGALLAYWRVDIIVTTLMLSTIAILLTAYLVTGPLRDPEAGLAGSPRVADEARLPLFSAQYGIGLDLVIALLVVVVLGLVLTRSVWGLQVRQLGEMNRFAEYTGVSPKKMSMQVMALSGAAAGIAGVLFVLGPNGGRFLQNFSPGYGFLGITVALLARLNPWAALVAAAFYANMMAGSNAMQINAGVPFPLVNVLQGLIILSITAVFVVDRRTRDRVLAMLPIRRPGATAVTTSGAELADAPAQGRGDATPVSARGAADRSDPRTPSDDGDPTVGSRTPGASADQAGENR
ncbi:heme ABC transporter ATP-binding protein [Actinotalea ferrariae CF5-4]|uniref:Heme ABC transporter ATP-binding protein n=1 Tax=Actinotalea ferrariae CF5-4 TaxID=948458 RepID=A0A021VV55_9CELL|nr:ATP-binding cassette domain-containing protein [Actinotalea ferrariae]EYR65046.1 heme ABC transporter ATP-binding protein [Actinotalea ferrariae CF5-4]